MPKMPEPNRRDLLKSAAAAGFAGSLGGVSARPAAAADPSNPITIENQKTGTRDWMTTKTHVDPATKYRSPAIEGFAGKTSVRPGESISFHVSTNPASSFVIDIYRLGHYQGQGGRHLLHQGPFKGSVQSDPAVGPMRLRQCDWEPCVSLKIPDDWTSGIYLGKLTSEREGLQSYIVFVVRDDRKADFLLQVSDNTWNAYNRWPSQFSLYEDGHKLWYWGPDVQTSFDRPYGKYCQILDAPLSIGSGEFLLWEFPLVFWMEQLGYNVTYISNIDTHSDPDTLKRGKAWISTGHDEYWSIEMFDHMMQAVRDGLNLAFLSGNSICGVVRIHPSTDGRPNRIIERVGRFGGPSEAEIKKGFPEMAKFKHNGPNEATLMGARSTHPITGGAAWTCLKPDHWLFESTGMKAGDAIPGLVGWEYHGDPAPIAGLEVVAGGKTFDGTYEGTYTATLYPGPKGNLVFNAATVWWADGLSEPPGYVRPAVYTKPQGPDRRVQQITKNLFERFLKG